uniref:Mon2/Sec7/BIG1-like HDS domain-containing protein n=2 Tax=Timema TaxID=61471 RepID=A0A7R9IT77_9NEOP|nr:unnamed protein product [Timema tahoe]
MLTAKNLQCMRALLVLAHCHGSILGNAWHSVLTTLQHLVWILGLKPSTGGSLKAGRTPSDSNAVITTAVMADLPVLSAMLSRLFESSQYLDDVALHHLIDALCKMSHEAMELAYSNRKLQTLLLGPLSELSSVPHGDVRQRQLECVLQILHSAGETLSHGWPLVLSIIGAVSDHHG